MSSTSKPRPKPAPQPSAASPRRWLVVQASAVLATVAASNYVCFGGARVPRYGVGETPPPPRDPATLCAEVIVRGPGGEQAPGALRFAELDARFKLAEQSERQVVWAWSDPARALHGYWVWDFFRLLSHVVLRVALPAPGKQADVIQAAAWAETLAALRSIAPGDTLSVRVQSPCGHIQQAHTLLAAASEWEPPASPTTGGSTA